MSGCVFGEAKNAENLCETCPMGEYTVVIDSESCIKCIDHANCPGGFVIEVDPGYWRYKYININKFHQ